MKCMGAPLYTVTAGGCMDGMDEAAAAALMAAAEPGEVAAMPLLA